MKGKKRRMKETKVADITDEEQLFFDKPIEEVSDAENEELDNAKLGSVKEKSSSMVSKASEKTSDSVSLTKKSEEKLDNVQSIDSAATSKLSETTDILVSSDTVGELQNDSANLNDNESKNSEEKAVDENGNVVDEAKQVVTSSFDFDVSGMYKIRGSSINMYDYAESEDSSDEEDLRNTVGNIPMEWYDDFPHIGYDLDGKKIMKPLRNKDELDKFLDKMENPDYWRTIHDRTTGRDHVLTEEELTLVDRLKQEKFFDPNYNPYEPYIDFFTHEKMIHPVTNMPEHKRSFVPSIHEKRKVGRLVHAIKMGWLKVGKPKKKVEEEQETFYDLWADVKDDPKSRSELARQKMHIPAPKENLPGHEASYNPAPEYLPNEEEIQEWKEEDPEFRKLDFIPKKFDSLRRVPQYENLVQERFSRCLDLYLCPRQRKMKVQVNPEELIPKLPKPSDLKPFPTFQTLCYRGHKSIVMSISVDASGQWLASGSKDGVVRVWEVSTARCVREITTFPSEASVKSVSWCPNVSVCLLAVAVGNSVVIINPFVGDRVVCQSTDKLIESFEQPTELDEDGKVKSARANVFISPWELISSGPEFAEGQRIRIKHPKEVGKVIWHGKGDYFASTLPGNGNHQVFLHQLTKLRSQNPFSKCKGIVQTVAFHPIRPFFFVATQTVVKVYNLAKQELTKKLTPNCKWISSIAVHPGGDNILIGSYDSRLAWIDLDLSSKPYHTMRYHGRAVRACAYHRKYPLFASAGDDCSVIVSHGMVYNDLMQNALIVPVKVLKGHKSDGVFGVMDICFHPDQPWVFSSGADSTIRLFT